MSVAIIGGGAAGLFAALLLARAGHHVDLFERERLDPPPDLEAAAAAAFRWTAPQIVQPHIVMARCRELLAQRLPDVLEGLLAAGVVEAPVNAHLPPALGDISAAPGDEHLTTLMTRRSTFDWVLQRAVVAEPGISVHGGVEVTGLLAMPGAAPRVTGVRTRHGDRSADLVLDASGRRSSLDDWLAAIGARPAATSWAECGVSYFSCHYRVRPASALPGPTVTRVVLGLDEFTVGIWGGDNGAMQMAVAPLAGDHRFRTVRHPQVFSAVLRTIPIYAAWLDVLEPISPVFPMGGLHNTLRRLVVDGEPVVTGLHSVGDSVCTTNPTLGRGLSLALWGACDLLDVITRYPDDPPAQARALDNRVAEHVVPFYEDQAAIDAARLSMLRHTIFGAPFPEPAACDPQRITYAQLRGAAQLDPLAFRAYWHLLGMLRRPDEVYRDPPIVAATHAVLREHANGAPVPQPDHAELMAALATE